MKYLKSTLLTLRVYLYNIIYVIDILGNVLLGGDRRETISSRLGKGKVARKPIHTALSYGVDFLFFLLTFEGEHCIRNIQDFEDEFSVSSIWYKSLRKYS